MKKFTTKENERKRKEKLADVLSSIGNSIGMTDWVDREEWDLTLPDEDPGVSPLAGKKRGAPKGNQNARKHGLYSKIAPARRRGDMDKALDMESLTQEAAMLRLLLAKLMENPDENLKEILQILRVLTPIVKLNLMVEDDDDSLL